VTINGLATNDLAGPFVVMHSGNVGHAQDLDNLIRATTFLRDVADLTAVIVGFGARHEDHVALAAQLDADAVRFLPYQPREILAQSLSSAEVHFVASAMVFPATSCPAASTVCSRRAARDRSGR